MRGRSMKFNQLPRRGFASRTSPRLKVKTDSISPLYRFGGVHGGASHQKTWRNKPLFRREVGTEFRFLRPHIYVVYSTAALLSQRIELECHQRRGSCMHVGDARVGGYIVSGLTLRKG